MPYTDDLLAIRFQKKFDRSLENRVFFWCIYLRKGKEGRILCPASELQAVVLNNIGNTKFPLPHICFLVPYRWQQLNAKLVVLSKGKMVCWVGSLQSSYSIQTLSRSANAEH